MSSIVDCNEALLLTIEPKDKPGKSNNTTTQFFTKKTFKFTIDQKKTESKNSKTKPRD